MSGPMTEAQFAAIRANDLRLIRTLLDGHLLVRERDGTELALNEAGDLEPYREPPTVRVTAGDLTDVPRHG